MATEEPELIPASQIGPLVNARAIELGGVPAAAKAWDISPQMVHMAIKGTRRPSAKMLKDLGLVKVKDVSYRRVGGKDAKGNV